MTISEEHIENICKRGQGKETCRYLTVRPNGWACAKLDPAIKYVLDSLVLANRTKSHGDNCDGVK